MHGCISVNFIYKNKQQTRSGLQALFVDSCSRTFGYWFPHSLQARKTKQNKRIQRIQLKLQFSLNQSTEAGAGLCFLPNAVATKAKAALGMCGLRLAAQWLSWSRLTSESKSSRYSSLGVPISPTQICSGIFILI